MQTSGRGELEGCTQEGWREEREGWRDMRDECRGGRDIIIIIITLFRH